MYFLDIDFRPQTNEDLQIKLNLKKKTWYSNLSDSITKSSNTNVDKGPFAWYHAQITAKEKNQTVQNKTLKKIDINASLLK